LQHLLLECDKSFAELLEIYRTMMKPVETCAYIQLIRLRNHLW